MSRNLAIVSEIIRVSFQLLREYMPCFYNIIRTSRLTLQERQVCILIRLGCTTQSIMTILHIAHTSGVSNVKRSANKKLFHNDNTRAMYDSIISLEKEMMCVCAHVCTKGSGMSFPP